ncbi:uncharacterized protein KQ657_000569 [Scheffersomyces spartinae]|uniref:FF domain-containing protein n=1 Tax=Scheffersomyces spartinae TaxID=45513 RepID=A0A9P7V949_9ASCO|nr:uncharacterized protein KQ657_000569 [Scheffersomyces spartinae]KAG7193502.1 hypothetical protein KQ657_000569 [Scheffersomyces spartinae]
MKPIKCKDDDDRWYVVIMEGGAHFYYDRTTGSRYWQLGEINGNENLTVDFDRVSMLMGMARGLKWDVQDRMVEPDTDVPGLVHDDDTGGEESNHDNESTDAVDNDDVIDNEDNLQDNNQLIMNLLKLEGYIEEDQKESGATLVEGYSSSEEVSEDESKRGGSEGLDHDSSDNDDNKDGGGTESFLSLLDEFKEEIDMFSTWTIVEGDLLTTWVTRPEYYAISDPQQKEALFNEWVKTQTQKKTKTKIIPHAKRADDNGGGDIDNNNIETTPSIEGEVIRATPRMEYLRLLLREKRDVKRFTFPEFFNKHRQDECELDLGDQKSTFLAYKIVLNDQESFERLEKHKYPNQNMKVLALERWLSLKNLPRTENLAGYSFKAKSAYDQWLELAHTLRLPLNLLEHPLNFVVGDEKRLDCYIGVVSNYNEDCK